ncbi:hypothetical protein AB9K41_12650, partial [Cribrihabitans sp. XS_ASV171]
MCGFPPRLERADFGGSLPVVGRHSRRSLPLFVSTTITGASLHMRKASLGKTWLTAIRLAKMAYPNHETSVISFSSGQTNPQHWSNPMTFTRFTLAAATAALVASSAWANTE